MCPVGGARTCVGNCLQIVVIQHTHRRCLFLSSQYSTLLSQNDSLSLLPVVLHFIVNHEVFSLAFNSRVQAIRFSRVIYHLRPPLNHATKINMFTKEIGNYFRQPSNFVCLKICLLISCHKLAETHTERQVRCSCSMRCSLVSLYVHVCTNSRVQAKRLSAGMFFRLKIWCLN